MEQIRGWHYHHQKPPTKASRRLAGHKWPTDHPQGSASNVDPRGLFHQHPASSPKINSQKYTKPEVTPTVRTSSLNLACVPKARLWAHIQSFSSKPSHEVWPPHYTNIKRTLRSASETPLVSRGAVCSLSPHQPGECHLVACSSTKPHSPTGHGNNECNKVCQSDKVVIELQK